MTPFVPAGYNPSLTRSGEETRRDGMVVGAEALDKAGGRVEEHGLLFEYTVKLLVLAAFLELVLYRLISRLGMHLGKVAEKYEFVGLAFRALGEIGFALLNTVAVLVFLALFILLFRKAHSITRDRFTMVLVPATSLLVLLTVAFLYFPPSMLHSVLYTVLAFIIILVLVVEYLVTHQTFAQRAFGLSFFFGISGWLYYQSLSTTYGMLGLAAAPPAVHAASWVGEALMVLASILVLWAYGGVGVFTRNKRHRRRVLTFAAVGGTAFLALLFMDYFLALYDEALAEGARKAGEGISWIFQMGMGYTFYLPFALYVTGLLCWSYTVLKLITTARFAGYGLGLMFMAGYALQLSHLTLMVVLGLMLLNLDRRRAEAVTPSRVGGAAVVGPVAPLVGEKT